MWKGDYFFETIPVHMPLKVAPIYAKAHMFGFKRAGRVGKYITSLYKEKYDARLEKTNTSGYPCASI